jgi:hypothetical protein
MILELKYSVKVRLAGNLKRTFRVRLRVPVNRRVMIAEMLSVRLLRRIAARNDMSFAARNDS